MKTLLFLAFLSFGLPGHSAERDIGTILGKEDIPPEKSDVTVSYVYDGKSQLFLTLRNVEMNASVRGVSGSIALHKAAILIHPKERYDGEAAVESLGWYSIRYVIPNVKPGIYTLVHDDTKAEGKVRVTRTVLNLTKATKGMVTVNFKGPPPEKAKAPETGPPPPFIEPEAEVPDDGAKPAN